MTLSGVPFMFTTFSVVRTVLSPYSAFINYVELLYKYSMLLFDFDVTFGSPIKTFTMTSTITLLSL